MCWCSSVQEHHVEFQVIRILESAGAIEYLPQFALHRITIETLLQMNHDGLKRVSGGASGRKCWVQTHSQWPDLNIGRASGGSRHSDGGGMAGFSPLELPMGRTAGCL